MLDKITIPGTPHRTAEFALGVMPWGTLATHDEALALYDEYRAAGGNTLDTAHIYSAWEKNGMGASERALGKVLRARGDRRNVLVISKGGHPPFLPSYPRPAKYLAPEVVRSDIGESLERLGETVGYIDIYLLHRDDRRVPVGELITLLNEESRTGRIRHFGVSNWRPERIEEANQYARAHGVAGFVASQPLFTLAQHNEPESADDTSIRFLWPADREWHERTQLPAFCYSPTAQGYFASNGKLATKAFDNATSRARLERARQFAAKRGGGVTTNQVAVAYIRAQTFPAIPILGTAKLEHLRDALQAIAVKLTAEEALWLERG